ncbi:MAG: hypothetical protein E7527_06405 [Ruminococcaceae bacterium]|nr:hypothetical protein [Oscillospiraceae bacterium]
MKKRISPTLLCILSVVALILVCFMVMPSEPADPHAGHDHGSVDSHGTTADPHAGHDHATNPTAPKKAKDCYSFKENKDGTFSYSVVARRGSTILQRDNADRPADFTAVSDDVLKVHGQSGTGVGARWAIFCNVETGERSKIFPYVLGSGKTQVAVVEHRTNNYHVFVYDQFDKTTEPEAVYTLEGLILPKDVYDPVSYEIAKNGDLEAIYYTKEGKQSITIKLK